MIAKLQREIDSLVVATGFHVTDSPAYQGIYGREGKTLAQVFDDCDADDLEARVFVAGACARGRLEVVRRVEAARTAHHRAATTADVRTRAAVVLVGHAFTGT